MYSGLGPVPVPTVVDPTLEASGQLPAAASALEQSGTPASLASKPGGMTVVRPAMFCSPSARVSCRLNAEEDPACGLSSPALSLGAKPPVEQFSSMVNVEVCRTGSDGRAQFVSCASAV